MFGRQWAHDLCNCLQVTTSFQNCAGIKKLKDKVEAEGEPFFRELGKPTHTKIQMQKENLKQ